MIRNSLNWSGMVYRCSVNWSSMIDRCSMNWGSMIDRCSVNWFMDRFWCRSISGNSLVHNLCNVARVCISGVVGHDLGTTIRKENPILPGCCITIPFLVLAKVNSAIIILNCVFVSVDCRGSFINRSFSISWGRMVGSWRARGKGDSQNGGECNASLLRKKKNVCSSQ